jgi:hypothetical protein
MVLNHLLCYKLQLIIGAAEVIFDCLCAAQPVLSCITHKDYFGSKRVADKEVAALKNLEIILPRMIFEVKGIIGSVW